MFFLLFLLDESGFGSGRPKNIWILRIRIREKNSKYSSRVSLHVKHMEDDQQVPGWIMTGSDSFCIDKGWLASNLEKEKNELKNNFKLRRKIWKHIINSTNKYKGKLILYLVVRYSYPHQSFKIDYGFTYGTCCISLIPWREAGRGGG